MNRVTYNRTAEPESAETASFAVLDDFLQTLQRRRRQVYLITALGTFLAIVILLLAPNRFEAKVRLMPEAGGSTDKLAMMASSILPQGVLSSSVLSKVSNEGANLEALLNSRRVLDAVLHKQYALTEEDFFGDLTELWNLDNIEYARQKLQSITAYKQDLKSGVVSISVETTSPILSATIANSLAEELDRFKIEMEQQQARTSCEYLKQQIVEAEKSLTEVEKVQTDFLSRNRNYLSSSDPNLTQAVETHGREVLFRSQVVYGLKQLYTATEMDSHKQTPRLAIIERAEPPLLKSWPPRTTYLMVSFLGSLLFAVGLVALNSTYRNYLPTATQHGLSESAQVVREDVKNVVNRMTARITKEKVRT